MPAIVAALYERRLRRSQTAATIQSQELPALDGGCIFVVNGRLTHERARFNQPEFLVGVMPLGRDCGRLLDLWMETTGTDSMSRRICHDCGLLHVQRVVDVAGEHCNHVRRLVAVAAGVLRTSWLVTACHPNGLLRDQNQVTASINKPVTKSAIPIRRLAG
jgi:hypothetical protein